MIEHASATCPHLLQNEALSLGPTNTDLASNVVMTVSDLGYMITPLKGDWGNVMNGMAVDMKLPINDELFDMSRIMQQHNPAAPQSERSPVRKWHIPSMCMEPHSGYWIPVESHRSRTWPGARYGAGGVEQSDAASGLP